MWIENYEPNNVFNSGETAVFYKYLPDKSMVFKTEKCHVGKNSKERVTILLVTI